MTVNTPRLSSLDIIRGAVMALMALDHVRVFAAGAHPVHFAAQFRRYYGSSVGEYRQSLRASRAIALLRDTDVDLSRVAALMGYTDQVHFTRVFARAIGIPPGRFRRLVAERPPSNHSIPIS